MTGSIPAPALVSLYASRHRWRDGTSEIVFDPLTFLERLAALVPRLRAHLLTYHGVLAPAHRRDVAAPACERRGVRVVEWLGSPDSLLRLRRAQAQTPGELHRRP